jgi:exodeoxyribonuclease VII large subunit
LARGFARVTGPDGKTISSSGAAKAARDLQIRFADGTVDALVGGSLPTAGKAPAAAKPASSKQQDLFGSD